jgi:amidase
VVGRLRAAGAVFLGHTNMPMHGDDFQSYNDLFGRTSNPWDLTRTAGGSTGGGGAAVAAGLSYLEIGSDFGGSIRVPSHFNGIYGHRGTRNVIPTEGHGPPRPGRPPRPKSEESVVGPLARSAADLRLALEIGGGPVEPMSVAYRWQLPPARGNALKDYRIGYVVDDPFCRVSSDLREAYERAIAELRAAGARLEEGWPADDLKTIYHAWYFLIAMLLSPELEGAQLEAARTRARTQDGSRPAIWSKASVSPYARYITANGERLRIRDAWQEWFRTHDAFLMPTTFVAAFPHDTASYAARWSRTLQTPEGPREYLDLHVWPSLSGLTGHPATVAPAGRTRNGLPAGFQVLGPYLEDATSIDVAAHVAEVLGGYQRPPGY